MFQNLFLSDWTQIDWDNSHKYITIQIHKKWNHSLKFWNAFCEFHKRSTKKWIISKNPRYAICGVHFFTVLEWLLTLSRESRKTPWVANSGVTGAWELIRRLHQNPNWNYAPPARNFKTLVVCLTYCAIIINTWSKK